MQPRTHPTVACTIPPIPLSFLLPLASYTHTRPLLSHLFTIPTHTQTSFPLKHCTPQPHAPCQMSMLSLHAHVSQHDAHNDCNSPLFLHPPRSLSFHSSFSPIRGTRAMQYVTLSCSTYTAYFPTLQTSPIGHSNSSCRKGRSSCMLYYSIAVGMSIEFSAAEA